MKRTIGLLALLGFVVAGQGHLRSATVPPSTVPGPTRTPPPTRCAPVDDSSTARSVFRYGVSPTDLQADFFGSSTDASDGSYNDAGYRPVRLTGYVDAGQVRFATKWVQDAGPEWRSRFGMTGAQFHARY